MDKPYFVILFCQNGNVTPMVDDSGELSTYETRGAACADAGNNPLGAHFGFEIHEIGAGEGY